MEQKTTLLIVEYLKKAGRPVAPRELALALVRSRVTIHSKLNKLVLTGWLEKVGKSPRVFYRLLETDLVPGFQSNTSVKDEPLLFLPAPTNARKTLTLDEYIEWCRKNGLKVPDSVTNFIKDSIRLD